MSRKQLAALGFTFLLFFSGLIAGCSRTENKDAAGANKPGAPEQRKPGEGEKAIKVETAAAKIKPIALVKQYVGEIRAFSSVDVRGATSGWLTSINVDVGDMVNRNEVICVIEHEAAQGQTDQAEAAISIAKASVARAEAELERASNEARRTENLYKKGYISEREQEQALSAEKQAQASLDAAKGQLAQAQAQMKNLMVQLGDFTIRSPFRGIVSRRYVDPGAYISPANPIVTLVDDSSIKAVVNVVEEDFPRLRPGAASAIFSDSYPGRSFQGKILRVTPAVDRVSKTAAVEILAPNPDGKLRDGMTARVDLVVAENPAGLVIPESAVRRDVEASSDFVFTVVDGKAARKSIKTGIVTEREAEILSGLESGDVVITGDIRITNGMKVDVAAREGGSR